MFPTLVEYESGIAILMRDSGRHPPRIDFPPPVTSDVIAHQQILPIRLERDGFRSQWTIEDVVPKHARLGGCSPLYAPKNPLRAGPNERGIPADFDSVDALLMVHFLAQSLAGAEGPEAELPILSRSKKPFSIRAETGGSHRP